MKRVKLSTLVFALSITLFAGAVGSLATFPAIPTWYAQLAKPSFTPPNWLFGPVWTILYLLMGVSFYMVKVSKAKKDRRIEAIQFFISQLAFNAMWSIIFFGLRSPAAAFGAIVALWLLILFTIHRFWAIKKTAAYLMVPYILWVSFAAVLNFAVALLNS